MPVLLATATGQTANFVSHPGLFGAKKAFVLPFLRVANLINSKNSIKFQSLISHLFQSGHPFNRKSIFNPKS
jgi:hypothetical protein